MRIAKIALITLVILLPGLANAQEKGSTQEKTWGKLTPFERAKKTSRIKGSRKLDIKPVVPVDGITTGCVIAYGHFLRPPFAVSYVEHKLVINGVQVEPSLLLEREQKNKKPVAAGSLNLAQRRIDVSKEIREKYQKEKNSKSESQLRSDILAFAKSKDGVFDAKWDNNAFMISFSSSLGFGFMELDAPVKPENWTSKSKDVRLQEAEQQSMEMVKSTLGMGDCLVFGGDAGRMSIKDPRENVIKIMADEKTTVEQKAELLGQRAFLGSYEEAFDVIENYNSREWDLK